MEFLQFGQKLNNVIKYYPENMNYKYTEDKIEFCTPDNKLVYTKEQFQELTDRVCNYEYDNCCIYNSKKFEMVIVNNSSYFINERRFIEMETIVDAVNGLRYSIKNISDILLFKIFESIDIDGLPIRIPFYKIDFLSENDDFNIISLLSFLLKGCLSVTIESDNDNSFSDLKNYANSFLFNIAYNMNVIWRPLENLDDLFPKRNIKGRVRTRKVDELMAPQLLYNTELTEQYYMALISDDVFVKYICFYHIFENFYEEVYNEALFDSVKKIIQNPGFSSKRNKDIASIIDIVSKKRKQNKEGFQGTELEALELTFLKYIDFTSFSNDLQNVDPMALSYYKSVEVPFSSGDTVDLTDITNKKLAKKLAARIYKTRNSLVHSKSNDFRTKEKGIYKPLTDNKDLSKEIPLMKLLAEKIIIADAEQL